MSSGLPCADRKMTGGGVGWLAAIAPAQVVAAHDGHRDVEQEQIGTVLFGESERLAAVAGRHDAVADTLEPQGDQQAHVVVVVCHQDQRFGCHD